MALLVLGYWILQNFILRNFHIFQKINIKLDGLDCEFLLYQTNGFIGIGVLNLTEFYFKNFLYFFAYYYEKRML